MNSYEVTMENKVTGWHKTYVVVCEDIEMAEEAWHEVHESSEEFFSDADMKGVWAFRGASLLSRCEGCGGLRRPGPPGTGAVSL